MSLLVAAIFIPYFGSMAGIFLYISHTGRHRDEGDEDEPEPAVA